MNREEVKREILSIPNNNILLELPTSFGKTKIALELLKKHYKKNSKILIVVPKLVLINTWKDEFAKWKLVKYLPDVTFITYASFIRHTGEYSLIIFDEAHHFSERCAEAMRGIVADRVILLSATVPLNKKALLRLVFKNLEIYRVPIKKAIEDNVLPDPKVLLLPIYLDNSQSKFTALYNKKAKETPITCSYDQRWYYARKYPKNVIQVKCTAQQYHYELNAEIEYYKRRYLNTRSEFLKTKWLRLCGNRLKWLSEQKEKDLEFLLYRLEYFNQRYIVFCNNIKQSESLGNSINSNNKDSLEICESFNSGNINHISACCMLDEGVNLVNCRIGVYANLSSSEVKIRQRLGRLLRHKSPIIIIPYIKDSREEEIMESMLEDYNPELVEYLERNNYKSIEKYIMSE